MITESLDMIENTRNVNYGSVYNVKHCTHDYKVDSELKYINVNI